jgi:hypothetical protein
LNVKDDPLIVCVLADSFHQQFMIYIIEQPFDIEFQYPIVFPASLPGNRYGV